MSEKMSAISRAAAPVFLGMFDPSEICTGSAAHRAAWLPTTRPWPLGGSYSRLPKLSPLHPQGAFPQVRRAFFAYDYLAEKRGFGCCRSDRGRSGADCKMTDPRTDRY